MPEHGEASWVVALGVLEPGSAAGSPNSAGVAKATYGRRISPDGAVRAGCDWLGTCFRTNRPCRLVPAHQVMKSRSCGLAQRIGAADSATPHPDPSGGQAPALHFLIPPSTIGLQFGTFRPWRAGIEVDWRAHPGSESGTCFRTNDGFGAGMTRLSLGAWYPHT